MRSVVEKGVILIFLGKVKDVYVAFPDGLGAMPCARNHEMVRKNRIGIEQDVVFLALASLEAEECLLGEAVAEKAGPLSDRGLVELCRRRNHTRRVVLHNDVQPPYVKFPGLHTLERPEVRAGKRPAGCLLYTSPSPRD